MIGELAKLMKKHVSQVAIKIKEMHDGGLNGILMVFQAYLNDTIRFKKDIMPILYEMGVITGFKKN